MWGRSRRRFVGKCCGQYRASVEAGGAQLWRRTRRACVPARSTIGATRGMPERVLIAPPDLRAGRSADGGGNLLWPLSPVRSPRRDRRQIAVPARHHQSAMASRCMASAGCGNAGGRHRARRRQRARARSPTGSTLTARASRASPGTRRHGPPHHRLAAAFVGGAAGRRVALLPRLHEIACRADPLPALDGAGHAGRQGEAARAHRAGLRGAVAAGPARRCAPRPATSPPRSSGRSCRMAATSRATRWRCWSCWPISCRCARPMPTRPRSRRRH